MSSMGQPRHDVHAGHDPSKLSQRGHQEKPAEILSIRSLCKSFSGVQILRSVDLSVQAQELVFIIGPSGSGKSTFLRCMNRLEEPDSGSIFVDGVDLLSPKTNINLVRRRIGMVFQSFNLYPHMTAIANVALALRRVLKHDARTAETMAAVALDQVGLKEKARSYPAELSGGQQQRVAIARAIALEPKIMLFDEPTSALDPSLVDSVLAVVRDLRRLGMTMVIVSHEMRFARDAADRIILMQDGRIEEEGTPGFMFSAQAGTRTQAFLSRIGV
jgi:polar amino acid transport system ATP-binding protein